MTHAKHTPGPWTTILDHTAIRARGCTVAEVIPQPSGITEANARLIAAAPELLEALKGVVEEMELADFDPEDEGTWYGRAIAAIAKAEAK